MIKVEHLVKKYGNHIAVDDLTFEVEKGQIYGFLGPNGAGKSTTMNIMTGYLAATSGTVTINGFDILTQPEEAKKCIGYLPEMPPLYSDMTVAEYLLFVSELKKVPKKERKEQVEEIMQMVEIEEVSHRLIRNLSKGFKQRVGLAQAIIGYPDVIILDEPTVGLDPKQIIEIRSLIKKLSENHTIILSSHILSEISTICDSIMIISKGKLVACDTPEGLQKRMEQTSEIEVTMLGTKEQAEQVLSAIDRIDSYSFTETAEKDSIAAHIVTGSEIDIRKEVSVALTSVGMPVLSMNRVEKSLEDIFLELTDIEESVEEISEDETSTDEAENKQNTDDLNKDKSDADEQKENKLKEEERNDDSNL